MSFKEQKIQAGTDESYIVFKQGNVVSGIRMPYFDDVNLTNTEKGHYINTKIGTTTVNFLEAKLIFKTAPASNVVLALYVDDVAIGTITVTGGSTTGTSTTFTGGPYAEGSLLTYEFTTLTDKNLEGELIIQSEDI